MLGKRLLKLFTGPNEWPGAYTDFAPGDRVVWRSWLVGESRRPMAFAGTFVSDGPAPRVTIRHDGAPSTAQVRPHELYRESDYLALAGPRGWPQPRVWG